MKYKEVQEGSSDAGRWPYLCPVIFVCYGIFQLDCITFTKREEILAQQNQFVSKFHMIYALMC